MVLGKGALLVLTLADQVTASHFYNLEPLGPLTVLNLLIRIDYRVSAVSREGSAGAGEYLLFYSLTNIYLTSSSLAATLTSSRTLGSF